MKFTCDRRDLYNVVSQLSKAVAVKPQNQLLSGIYLKVEGEDLELQANNYSLGILARIPAVVESEGETVAIGKKLFDVVKALPNEILSIFYNKHTRHLEISVGRSNYSIPTMEYQEFPQVPQHHIQGTLEMHTDALRDLIKKTSFACSNDESHPIYTGCLWETQDKTITLVGTNMHRLSVARGELYDETIHSLRIIVPSDTLNCIAEMLAETKEDYISIDYTGKGLAFRMGRFFIASRIIDGNFPDYQKVIPSSNERIALLDIAELRNAIDRISTISKEDPDKKITFMFSDNILTLAASSLEYGIGEEGIDVEYTGSDLEISLNYTYILDALKILKGMRCRIAMNGHYDPIDIREEDGSEDYIYIATPIRT